MNIEELKKYSQILVVGHNKPDSDSMISSKLMADILVDKGINANYALLDWNVNDLVISTFVNECLIYKPIIVKSEDIDKYKYFLVDHNDIIQSVKNKDLVIGCIDHHPDSKSINNPVIKETCSTAIAIYEIFKNDYKFSDEQKKQIYFATLDDSALGKSARYKDSDKKIIEELGYNSDFTDAFLKYFVPTNFTNLEYAFKSYNYKKFTFGTVSFETTAMHAIDIMYLEDYKNFVINYPNNFLGIWIDFKKDITYTFFKYDSLYIEKTYSFVAPRSTVILKDSLDFLRRNDYDV